jgi:hypothetical protein
VGTSLVCRELGVPEQRHYRWRNQCGGLKVRRREEAQGAPEAEPDAEAELEKAALKELAEGRAGAAVASLTSSEY